MDVDGIHRRILYYRMTVIWMVSVKCDIKQGVNCVTGCTWCVTHIQNQYRTHVRQKKEKRSCNPQSIHYIDLYQTKGITWIGIDRHILSFKLGSILGLKGARV